jgi:hypothetical protein
MKKTGKTTGEVFVVVVCYQSVPNAQQFQQRKP